MSTDFAWLIEAPGQRYLSVRKLGNRHEFHWTQKHDDALRFHTAQQADWAMMAVRELAPGLFAFAANLGDARAVEHGWMTMPTAETKSAALSDVPGPGTVAVVRAGIRDAMIADMAAALEALANWPATAAKHEYSDDVAGAQEYADLALRRYRSARSKL